MRSQYCAPPFPNAGAGPAAEHPAHAVGLPPRTVRFEHPDGGRPVLRTGADRGECNGLCHSVSRPGAFAVCRLRAGWLFVSWLPLVRLDLRRLSAGARGPHSGALPWLRRAVGRLIMFKECLKYNIVPFIIEDNLKLFYYRGLKEWDNEKGYLTDTCLTAQDKYKAYLDYFRIGY